MYSRDKGKFVFSLSHYSWVVGYIQFLCINVSSFISPCTHSNSISIYPTKLSKNKQWSSLSKDTWSSSSGHSLHSMDGWGSSSGGKSGKSGGRRILLLAEEPSSSKLRGGAANNRNLNKIEWWDAPSSGSSWESSSSSGGSWPSSSGKSGKSGSHSSPTICTWSSSSSLSWDGGWPNPKPPTPPDVPGETSSPTTSDLQDLPALRDQQIYQVKALLLRVLLHLTCQVTPQVQLHLNRQDLPTLLPQQIHQVRALLPHLQLHLSRRYLPTRAP